MKPLLFLLLFVAIPCSAFSQNIKGTVIDKNTQQPVSEAHIYLKKHDFVGISDEKGEFLLGTSSKIDLKDTLIVSHIAYQKRKLTFLELKELKYTIMLEPKKRELVEIGIKADKIVKKSIKYNKLTSLKSRQYAFGSTKVGNKIYIIGGDESASTNGPKKGLDESYYASSNAAHFDFEDLIREINRASINYSNYNGDLRIYDVKTGQWKFIASQFEKRAYHNIHFYNDKIYILGGKRIARNRRKEYLSDKIEVYNTKNYSVKVDYTNPHQAVNFASVLYKDNIIVLGGSVKLRENGAMEYTNKVHLYNITSGYWYELENMPQEKEVNGILINDKIYLVGGYYEKVLNHIETFDLSTSKWEVEAELFTGMLRPALAYHNQILYIFENGKLCTYNLITKQLNEYKINLYLNSSAMYYSNNKLIIFGGFLFDEYSVAPSAKVFSINLTEFIDTKINKSKIF